MIRELSLNLYSILAAGWRRRYAILIPMLIVPIIGTVVGIVYPNTYQTETSILIQEPSLLNPFLKDYAVPTQVGKRMRALNAMLHSRYILLPVAKKLNMINDDMSEAEVHQVLVSLSPKLKAQLIGSDLVHITYTDTTPAEMAELLKTVAIAFINNLLYPQYTSITGSEAFLKQQITERKKQLDAAEQKLTQFKLDNVGELPATYSAHAKRLIELQKLLAEREIQLTGSKATLEEIEKQLVQLDPVIGRLEADIINTTEQLVYLRARYTDEHSQVQATKQKLDYLIKERSNRLETPPTINKADVDRLWQLASATKILASSTNDNGNQPLLLSQLNYLQRAQAAVVAQTQEIEHLKNEIRTLKPKLEKFSQKETELKDLERNYRIHNELYNNLVARHQQALLTTELGQAQQNERIKILNLPVTPTRPINPKLWFFIFAGVVGGIALGIGLAVLLEMLDTSIRRRDYLEKIMGVPVLGRLPTLSTPTALASNIQLND